MRTISQMPAAPVNLDDTPDNTTIRFDPVDIDQVHLLLNLAPGERIRVMLDAQALAKGLIMGRLRRQYPDLASYELGLKFVEEIERAKQTRPGP
jgi:hypothetical protein